MHLLSIILITSLGSTFASNMNPTPSAPAEADPYIWLEEVDSVPAMAWVRACNAASQTEIASSPEFRRLRDRIQESLDSDDRIPYISKRGDLYYNFWRDAANPRGLFRRTTLESYRTENPEWDILLDIDALNEAENETWVWKGVDYLKAGGYRHAMLRLSRGGSDAVVVREFDLETRRFVENGFFLPEAKGDTAWIDKDTLYVTTDFGPGSMTTSGYPRIVKRWTRGTPLKDATVVFEGQSDDVGVSAGVDDTPGFERHFVVRRPTFYTSETYIITTEGELQKIEVPADAEVSFHREWLLVTLRSAWDADGVTYPEGALLAIDFDAFMKGNREFAVLFEPTPTASLAEISWTRNHLLVNVMEDVQSHILTLTPTEDGKWDRQPLTGAPDNATISVWGEDEQDGDAYFMSVTGFLTPSTLARGTFGAEPEALKSTPSFFKTEGLSVSQHFAVSKDGTRIPYFQVSGPQVEGKPRPTLLYGYGGFEVPMQPYYSPSLGLAWLEQGGVYVLANIRGGGEYGPSWHQAALRENRYRAFEDFAAVARDLFERGITQPELLGALGGSNGGLLVGNMITLYPELFRAVVCQVPLLDMQRYHLLLAGASWKAEYGDPDNPDDWAFMKGFSPYHNLRPNTRYPAVLFATSTRDDRVHPAHARKMMARMQELGANVRYYENIEGGHGGAADNRQAAHLSALGYMFLQQQLRLPADLP